MGREQSPKKVAKRRGRPYQRVDKALGQTPVVLQVSPAPQAQRVMTPRQLADFLQVHPNTIRRHLRDLPHIRVGGNRVRFDPADVVAHLKAQGTKKS